jgi:hypothetical protein
MNTPHPLAASTIPFSPSIIALALYVPEAPVTIEPPDGIFAGLDVPKHLSDLYAPEALLCGSPYRTVAAYVTAARLWTPSRAVGRAALAAMYLFGDNATDPLNRSAAWVSSLSAAALDVVEAHAGLMVERLYEDMADPHAETWAPHATLAWLDELTSVTIALVWSGRGARIAERVAAFEREHGEALIARIMGDATHREAVANDDRFGAVSWQEPTSLVARATCAARGIEGGL